MADEVETGGGFTERVNGVIDKIRPLLQADGGDIELVSVDESAGVVSVRLQGACKGCPGAAITLKMGVERHLKEQVPEVKELVAVE
ncbi:MAG: NifU family protein [Planctomycetota bacterium]|jgi:Fe-S cluster biogenesis protein NfuA